MSTYPGLNVWRASISRRQFPSQNGWSQPVHSTCSPTTDFMDCFHTPLQIRDSKKIINTPDKSLDVPDTQKIAEKLTHFWWTVMMTLRLKNPNWITKVYNSENLLKQHKSMLSRHSSWSPNQLLHPMYAQDPEVQRPEAIVGRCYRHSWYLVNVKELVWRGGIQLRPEHPLCFWCAPNSCLQSSAGPILPQN